MINKYTLDNGMLTAYALKQGMWQTTEIGDKLTEAGTVYLVWDSITERYYVGVNGFFKCDTAYTDLCRARIHYRELRKVWTRNDAFTRWLKTDDTELRISCIKRFFKALLDKRVFIVQYDAKRWSRIGVYEQPELMRDTVLNFHSMLKCFGYYRDNEKKDELPLLINVAARKFIENVLYTLRAYGFEEARNVLHTFELKFLWD